MKQLKTILLEKYFNISIKIKVIVPTMFVLFLSFLCFTIYSINDQKNKYNISLNNKVERVTYLITYTNTENLWNLNKKDLNANSESFFKDKEITKILIKEPSGEVLVDLSRDIKGSDDIIKKENFIKDNEKIGSLEIVFTNYYIEEELAQIRNKLLILILVVFALIIAIITVTSNIILKPLHTLMDKVNHLADGDLIESQLIIRRILKEDKIDSKDKFDIKSNDEIGKLAFDYNNFIIKISDVIKGIKDISDQLAVASEQMTAATQSFSDNVQNQAATAEEITATVEHVSAGMECVAGDVDQQFTNLNKLTTRIDELSTLINKMGEKMEETRSMAADISLTAKKGDESLRDMNSTISKIGESSGEMTNIVNIINDISDKINLLSLNAAIEAARAGDAGRGFAVVADEISKLADLTATSINDISKLIKANDEEIQKGMLNVNETVENTKVIINGVNSIGNLVETNFENMKKQLDTSNIVTEMADAVRQNSEGIKISADEQRNAMTEIVRSISNINDLTQSNASGAEEMSANSSEVSNTAEILKSKINFFKV